MIKLNEYLSYLNEQIASARRAADEQSISIAREYAKHEYLKYFSAPRFTIPVMKLDIPVAIEKLDYESQFAFEIDHSQFIKEVNVNIRKEGVIRKLKLPFIKEDNGLISDFKKAIEVLKKDSEASDKSIDNIVGEINIGKIFIDRLKFEEVKREEAEQVYVEVITAALKRRFTLKSTKLKELYINPQPKGSKDSDQMILRLNLDLEESGLRILKVKDKNGNEVEEIIFE